ncbi:MAG: arginine repressor [Oscillospiraceae bacterium]|jgi:transcriptional regulator of arginine metabolism
MKLSRQNVILEVITEQDIETQNQLMDALQERGIKSTQATISRDIKELRLVKELSPSGHYRYVSVVSEEIEGKDQRLQNIFRESVTSCDFAQNIVVLKTLPGLASAACSTLDSMDIKDLVGTIAGDDTAFLAMRDTISAEQICREIHEMIG